MSLASVLLLHGFLVAVIAPRRLRRLDRHGFPPAVAMAGWIAAMVAVVLSWTAGVIAAGVAVARAGGDLHALFVGCVSALVNVFDGLHGSAAQAAMLIAAVAAGLAVGALCVRVALVHHRARTRAQWHRDLALIIGDRRHGPAGTVVIEAEERVVYCVAGRPPAIVMTSAALACLDTQQLAAVLAHEHAHLRGRHHAVVAVTRALAKVMPRIRLFSDGSVAIARLVELRADEVAARMHDRGALVDALVALTGPRPKSSRALAASGIDVVERVERLLAGPGPSSRRSVVGVATALVGSYLLGVAALVAVPAVCGVILG